MRVARQGIVAVLLIAAACQGKATSTEVKPAGKADNGSEEQLARETAFARLGEILAQDRVLHVPPDARYFGAGIRERSVEARALDDDTALNRIAKEEVGKVAAEYDYEGNAEPTQLDVLLSPVGSDVVANLEFNQSRTGKYFVDELLAGNPEQFEDQDDEEVKSWAVTPEIEALRKEARDLVGQIDPTFLRYAIYDNSAEITGSELVLVYHWAVKKVIVIRIGYDYYS